MMLLFAETVVWSRAEYIMDVNLKFAIGLIYKVKIKGHNSF